MFWYDSWGGMPKRELFGERLITPNPKISLREAIERQNIGEEDWEGMDQVVLNNLKDALYWRFSQSGEFTTKSTYLAISQGGKIT